MESKKTPGQLELGVDVDQTLESLTVSSQSNQMNKIDDTVADRLGSEPIDMSWARSLSDRSVHARWPLAKKCESSPERIVRNKSVRNWNDSLVRNFALT